MSKRKITLEMKNKLWSVVDDFIKEQEIYCVESIYQCDNVILNATEFIEACVEIVGYYDDGVDRGGR